MSDAFIINKLKNEIKSLIDDNNAYKLYIYNLENSFIKLERDFSSLKYKYKLIESKESFFDNIKPELESKNKMISELEKELLAQKEKYRKDMTQKEIVYENDMGKSKRVLGMHKIKIKNSENIEKLNDLLYYKNLELEKEIIKIKEEAKNNMIEKEKEFEERLKDMKVHMLDFIKENEKLTQKKENISLNEKICLMQKNTLLNELEFQSLQLENLLKERKHSDKIISEMKTDIEIHKKVEKKLAGKNKKYSNIIHQLSSKRDKTEINQDKNNENYNSPNSNNNKDITGLNSTKKSTFFISPQNLLKSKINKNKNNKITFFNNKNTTHINSFDPLLSKEDILSLNDKMKKKNCSMDDNSPLLKLYENRINNKSNENSDKIILQRELIKKIKEIEDYKSKYESYKSKLDYLNNKYINIIILFDSALSKIESEIKNREIYIDVESMKKCDFEKLTAEQKYSIVILLVKYILPLINKDNLPEKIKNNLKGKHTKFFCSEYNESNFYNNSLSSTINGKMCSSSGTQTSKKMIELVGEKRHSRDTYRKTKGLKKVISNLNIDKQHYNSYSSAFNGYNIPKMLSNRSYKKIFKENWPNINSNNYPDIQKQLSPLKI